MDWQSLLEQLIAVVEETAPELWAIAIKQAYISATGFSMTFLFFCGIAVGLWALALSYHKKSNSTRFSDEFDDPYWTFLVFLVFSVLVFGFSLIFLYGAISRFINPEFYAIEILMNYVK